MRSEPAARNAGSSLTYESGGRRVRLEAFGLGNKEPQPAVLVLHGAGGIDAGHRYVRQFAGAIADAGFITLLVHYFDRTNTSYAGEATIHREFATWRETIADAVTFISELPGVDPQRLALAGYSLGGYLGMAQAARDSRIRAVVEIAGGIDDASAAAAKALPPLLVVHGRADHRVPFENALKVERVARRVGAVVETRFYPEEGHLLSAGAALDALVAGIDFLTRHLARATVSESSGEVPR